MNKHHNDNGYRWKAVLTYRTDNGPVGVTHHFEEIEDLHDIIERGPDWNTLERCVITLSRRLQPGLTVEMAATQ